jgi:hypothetical protein
VIGVICPELGAAEPHHAADTVRARLLCELSRRDVAAETVADLSLALRVYPDALGGSVDSILHPDLYRDADDRWISDAIKRGVDIVASAALLLGAAIASRLRRPPAAFPKLPAAQREPVGSGRMT